MKRPKILEDAGFDIYIDDTKLRDLSLPTEEVNIADLIWCFNFPVWEKDGTDDWNLTPLEVIENKQGTSDHRKRVNQADLNYPIVVIFHKNKWVILDGIHRLVKAYLLDEKTIKARILTKDSEYLKQALKIKN